MMKNTAEVVRLVTFVDRNDEVPDAGQISAAVRHEAVLDNGRRVLFLGDRGWCESGPPNMWVETSVRDIVDTARTAVGPDEPAGGRSHEDMEAAHWARPAGALRGREILSADATDLGRLPHDVVPSDRLLAHIGHHTSDDV